MKTFFLIAISVALTVAVQANLDSIQSLVGLSDESSELAAKPVIAKPSPPAKIYAVGRVEGATEQIQLRPEVSGFIKKIQVHEGQFVEAGDVLMQLDDREQRERVKLAQVQVQQTEDELKKAENGTRPEEIAEEEARRDARVAEYDQAKTHYTRLKELSSKGAVSLTDLDNARAKMYSAESIVKAAEASVNLLRSGTRKDEIQILRTKVEAAKSQLRLAEHKLTQLQLKAPKAGQILAIDAEVGEAAGFEQKAVIVMTDTRNLRVRAFVDELDACKLAVGQVAAVTTDGLADKAFNGQVISVAPRMSKKRLFTDAPDERIDTRVREIVIELEAGQAELVVGLKVDVNLTSPKTPAASSTPLALNN